MATSVEPTRKFINVHLVKAQRARRQQSAQYPPAHRQTTWYGPRQRPHQRRLEGVLAVEGGCMIVPFGCLEVPFLPAWQLWEDLEDQFPEGTPVSEGKHEYTTGFRVFPGFLSDAVDCFLSGTSL